MNLQSLFKNVAEAGKTASARMEISLFFLQGFFRQIRLGGLSLSFIMKLLSVRVRRIAACLAWALVLGSVSSISAQTNYYAANGFEYPIVGTIVGDQMRPDVAISATNGFVVWQDNATDGNGWGISARRLDGTLSGSLGVFRVNATAAGDQEKPRVALLKNGGAAFVWEGGKAGFQHIYARFLSASNIFLTTTDILVNTFTNNFQINPSVAVLTNGNLVVVWASLNQVSSNSMQDIYCQILTTNGSKVGTNFLVNQFITYNQRTPAVAALKNGGFVVSWISEQQRIVVPNLGSNTTYTAASLVPAPSVDIYARQYGSTGLAAGSEFRVNTGVNPCSSPAVAAGADGGYIIAWGEFDRAAVTNGWDIFFRAFNSAGSGGTSVPGNTHIYGDQYVPRISSIGLDYLLMWTSLGQDSSREGVYGQFVHNDGSRVGGEFRVNTTTTGQQMQPVVASDGGSQFLVIWSNFGRYPEGFDLYAQRFINVASVLQPISALYVWAPFVISNGVYQPRLAVSWPPLDGLAVTKYEVYVDGAGSPAGMVSSNSWVMTAVNGLTPNSTHYFQVDYIVTDGRRSPLSPSAAGSTWGSLNWGGIPSEWMIAYYGSDISKWPSSGFALAPNMTIYQVFLSGGNPLDPSTWLQQYITTTTQGIFLNWNSQPGATYQVQVTTNFSTWSNFGPPRFAAGVSESVNVGGGAAGYYRIVLLR